MNHSDLENLAAKIKTHSSDDFRRLSRAEILPAPATATFYWFPDSSNPEALVKVFTGDDAGSLYRQEITALYMLRATGRVCVVVCNSTKIQTKFWDEDLPGLYFIAKLFYPKPFESALRTATGLEKLDLAAQQVDIARLFLKLGWRDYDWRKENDVIDENGRLLRVDLDSASSLTGFFEQKSTVSKEDYFSNSERKVLVDFLTLREDLLKSSPSNEVRNMAIRLSHSIFIDENDKGELKQLIKELQQGSSPDQTVAQVQSTATKTELSTWFPIQQGTKIAQLVKRGAIAILKPRTNENNSSFTSSTSFTPPRILSEPPPIEDHSIFKRWMKLWLSQAPQSFESGAPRIETLSQLSRNELGLLGKLFHHIISNIDHEFSLDDLHASLLMLSLGCLRDRSRSIDRESWGKNETIERLCPNTRFFEVRNTLLHPHSGTVAVTDKEIEEGERSAKRRTKPPRGKKSKRYIPTIESSSAGGFWPAAKKELGRGCEDRAWVFSNDHFRIAVVIDGVSDASGLDSALIAQEAIEKWSQELVADSPLKIASSIKTLLGTINSLLIEKHKQTKEPHQAMLAIAIAGIYQDSCFACIAKAGVDSDCVVFNPDGSFKYSTKSDTMAPRLGEVVALKPEHFQVDHILINSDGTYRFRLFSDGVGDAGYEIIKKTETIEQLVKEAEHWHERLGDAVGFDDWSIAGFDIRVKQVEVTQLVNTPADISSAEDSPADDSPAKDSGTQESLIESVVEVDPTTLIQMSNEAKKVWVQIVDSTPAGEQEESLVNSFIRESVGQAQNTPKYEPLRKKVITEVPDVVNTPSQRLLTPKLIGFLIAVVIVSGAIPALIYVVFSWQTVPVSTNQQNNNSVPSPNSSSSSEIKFAKPKQKDIYEHLKIENKHTELNLPQGVEIREAQWTDFVADIADVIRQSKYSVSIDVYAGPGGDRNKNLERTRQRAIYVKQSLVQAYKIPDNQVDVQGRGLPSNPAWKGATVVINRRNP